MHILLLSSSHLQNDPRALYLARSLRAAGHEVSGLNIFRYEDPSAEEEMKRSYAIFREFPCRFIYCRQLMSNKYSVLLLLRKLYYKMRPKAPALSAFLRTLFATTFFGKSAQSTEAILNFFYHKAPRIVDKMVKEDASFFADKSVIYCTEMFMGAYFAYPLQKKLGIPLIFDVKELYSLMASYQPAYPAVVEFEQELFSMASILPCVSQKIIDYYQAQYPRQAHKFVLLENAMPFAGLVDPSAVTNHSPLKFIVSAGSTEPGRGFVQLAAIWEKAAPANAELHLRVKDMQPEEEAAIGAAAPQSFGRSIRVIPPVPEDEMTESLVGYDVGVLPYLATASINYRYCCPNKFGQYMNAGLALFSSNTEYIPPRIVANRLGAVYDPYDVEASAALLTRFIADHSALLEMKRNALRYAQQVYNWDLHVTPFIQRVDRLASAPRVAVFYFHNTPLQQTVIDSLECFGKLSRMNIDYRAYNSDEPLPDPANYDVAVVHYYSQVYNPYPAAFREWLKHFGGLKIIFAQDEYDLVMMNRKKYLDVKPDIIYSACAVNPQLREVLYPAALYPHTDIQCYLTGYVPDHALAPRPLGERAHDIFYRGNNLGFSFGRLGYEKQEIGIKMKAYAETYHLKADIEVELGKQIFGMPYLDAIMDARCVLCTEGGSSLIDFEGRYRSKVLEECRRNPDIKLEALAARYPDFFAEDGKYVVHVITPKVFEAVLCKTALVCYEGEYSGIIKPGVHYIPVKKDWSNIEEVVGRIRDVEYLQAMVDRAYRDIVESGRYSYRQFVREFDDTVMARLPAHVELPSAGAAQRMLQAKAS